MRKNNYCNQCGLELGAVRYHSKGHEFCDGVCASKFFEVSQGGTPSNPPFPDTALELLTQATLSLQFRDHLSDNYPD